MASRLERQQTNALGRVFDPRFNALNAWRLIFASMVIMQHSWPLTGRRMTGPFTQLLTEVWVDGFFVISGFLITSSWMRRPKLREYLAARLLRIVPGLWVCVLVVAFVIAPIGVLVQHGEPLKFSSQLAWALNNGLLNVFHGDIDGTPMEVPWPGVWDGPLWTLIFELICYIAVAVLGVAGLMSKRWTIPTVFVLSLIGAAAVGYPVLAVETIPQMVTRFALVFSAGALVYQFRDRLPANWSLVALCVVLVVAAGLLPNYRVYAALPLAYAVIVSGALLKRLRPQLRNDISYGIYIYGWPVQQLLAMMGLAWLPPGVFFVVATAVTIPLAAASWFLIEKRALKLKRYVQHRDQAADRLMTDAAEDAVKQ
ncbi:peptidoglycan/LPS O-acetylase OafA/YrhL [Mycobacterium frederiksbergense]|uniref:Peptidoglycan/LPS O-acetylase OafA/YrhL n=1 Tax=Mycolicibacterium frederiksbergense TaxID=117567 RepID=A0ABT6L4M6_9MYCO|nr:acyltransferase [Mycolicibacterium frederiksbergense]MDH6196940.1 peptidoglycan/LPS O-acetylase OafA/YrhL [Mycolicibacterium frederiksbergense]